MTLRSFCRFYMCNRREMPHIPVIYKSQMCDTFIMIHRCAHCIHNDLWPKLFEVHSTRNAKTDRLHLWHLYSFFWIYHILYPLRTITHIITIYISVCMWVWVSVWAGELTLNDTEWHGITGKLALSGNGGYKGWNTCMYGIYTSSLMAICFTRYKCKAHCYENNVFITNL